MKISIRQKEERPHHLVLHLPLWAVKLRVVSYALASIDGIGMDASELHHMIIKAYKQIKSYVRKHGHFYLVKVDTRDGTKIRIKL